MTEDLESIIARKTAQFEAAGILQNLYSCPYCLEGYVAIQSSVSDAMVHPDTPIGRVLCLPRNTPVYFGARGMRTQQ